MRTRIIAVAAAFAAAGMLCAYGQMPEDGYDTTISVQTYTVKLADLDKKLHSLNALTNIYYWGINTYSATTNYACLAKDTLNNIRFGIQHGNATYESATNAVALANECLKVLNEIKKNNDKNNNQSALPNGSALVDGSGKFGNLATWAAVGVAILAAIFALVAVIVAKVGTGSVKAKMEAEALQRKDETHKALEKIEEIIRKFFDDADLKSVKAQINAVKMSFSAMENKVSALDRDLREQPAKFDAVVKTFLRDAENQRRSIMDALFGRGNVPAENGGFVPQLEARLAALEKALLAAVTTERELQSRKAALDAREDRLIEREHNASADLAAAREEGATEAAKKIAVLEVADESLRKAFGEMQTRLSERVSAQSQEFGKRIASLEAERDDAVATSRKAAMDAADANRRATVAEQSAGKLKAERDAAVSARAADVARLNDAIRSRDEARDAEIARARENIRMEIEKTNADVMTKLKADAQSARDELVQAEETAKRAAADSAKTIASLRAISAETEEALNTAQAALGAEKSARAAEHAEAERTLAAEKAAHDSDCQKAKAEAAELSAARDAAKARLFPAELASDSGLKPLMESLDDMDAKSLPGAALARASLAIFADRKKLPDKIWLRALGDFSLGLATALEADRSADATSLAQWKAALEKFGAGAPSFSLRLPSIGDKVDIAWMHSKTGVATVKKVRSWAVFGSKGNAYMAEVE